MYISIKEQYRIVKKELGINERGNKVYREILEVTCSECKHVFEQDILHEPDGKVKIECPFCDN